MIQFFKKLFGFADVNKDGKVDKEDAKVVVEAAKEEVKIVAQKTTTAVKKAATKAKSATKSKSKPKA